MIWAALAPIVGSVVGKVLDKFADAEDPNLRNKLEMLRYQLEVELQKEMAQHAADIDNAASGIVLAEVQGRSWLQRNWRPFMMWMLMGLILWDLVLGPVAVAAGINLKIDVPDNVWTLLGIGMGGYVIGRSGEKMVQHWAANRPKGV